MIDALIVWGFPFYLIVVEMIFRATSGQDTTGFIGPTIATAGLTSLIALTQTRERSDQLSAGTARALKERGLMAISGAEKSMVTVVWAMILLGFLVWFWSCKASLLSK